MCCHTTRTFYNQPLLELNKSCGRKKKGLEGAAFAKVLERVVTEVDRGSRDANPVELD